MTKDGVPCSYFLSRKDNKSEKKKPNVPQYLIWKIHNEEKSKGGFQVYTTLSKNVFKNKRQKCKRDNLGFMLLLAEKFTRGEKDEMQDWKEVQKLRLKILSMELLLFFHWIPSILRLVINWLVICVREWDSSSCSCKCRSSPLDCAPGLHWDSSNCRCHRFGVNNCLAVVFF